MAVIEKLLLSTGGGIVSLKQQAEQESSNATVLIGLGGTGVSALRTIKTEVYSRLKPDNPNAIVPTYNHIRFLGVDTTPKTRGSVEHDQKSNSLLALDEDEFLFIGDKGLTGQLKNPDILNKVEQLEWFRHEDIKDVMLGDAGAGGVRQIGRYLFMNKSQDFANKLNDQIRKAKENRAGASLYIHLFAGLSGGTGSGAFLDVCYLIKKIAPNATVFGYFFLPDVNLSNISQDNNSVRAYIKKNGYAALQELDYCMQLDKNGGQLSQLYKGDLGYVDWRGAPVSLCHIIGAESVGGNVVSKPYDYAMNVTAEYVMDFLTKVNGDDFSLDQHLANCSSMMAEANISKTIASEVFYAVIGASCAKIPNREINTYLASSLFTKLTNVKGNLPSESEVEKIAIDAFAPGTKSFKGMYEEILKSIKKGAGNDYVDTHLDWKFMRDFDNSEIVEHYTNQRASKYNAIEKNKTSLCDDKNSESLINKLRKVLNNLVVDVNYGPNYAYGVLSNGTKVNIDNIIDGLIKENKDRYEQELIQDNLRMKEYDDAYQECKIKLKKVMGNHNKIYSNYIFRLVNVMKHQVDIEAYKAVDELLTKVKKKVREDTSGYYKKLSVLFNDLLETFDLNKTDLDSIVTGANNRGFAEELVSIHEIKEVLEQEVERLNLDGFMNMFISHLLDNEDKWLGGDYNKVAKLVNNFFVETVFDDFANKAITSFLQMKYNTQNDNVIENSIYNDWIKKLVAKSSPMFPVNTAVTTKLGNLGKVAFVSVPDQSGPIIKAANKYNSDDELYKVKPSGLQDRIYIMSSFCGMPLSAYQLLEQLEDEQFRTNAYTYGTHYYEGKVYEHNKDTISFFNEWNKLSPVIPVDLITDLRLNRMHSLKNRITEARKLFDDAIKNGIISKKDWYIYNYKENDKQKISRLIEGAKGILPKLKKPVDLTTYNVDSVLDELDNCTGVSKEKTNVSLVVDGNDNGIDTKRYAIMFDHFFSAPAYMEIVKDAVDFTTNTLAQIQDVKKELETKKAVISVQTKDINNYCDAIFSGVITFNGAMITYETDEFFGDIVELCKRDEEKFPYYSIPIYQGYLSYKEFSVEDKNIVRKKVNNLLNEAAPQLKDVSEKLKDLLSKEKLKKWVEKAMDDFSEAEEIVDMLKKFYKNYENWDYK